MITENQKSTHAIFTNKHNEKKLAYYPCPKNANTSAKLFFVKHLGVESKFKFIGDQIPSFKQTKKDLNGKKNLVNFLPNYQPFCKLNADIKCCFIRNPLERFVSTYRNRIMYHNDVQFRKHSIDMVLDKLENELFENKHFLPQNFFLGDNLEYYTFYTDVNNTKIFEDKVNEFFGKKIEFPKLQTGGKEIKVKLNHAQLDRISKIYAKDFELYSTKL